MDLFELIGWLWSNLLVIPMTNLLVFFSRMAFGNFGIAIILFTIMMRTITWPLNQQQLRSTRAMQAAQPRIQEIQKKYKDPRRRSEETMKVYREVGFSPLGCVWPMLIQFPIWIALYQAIRITLGSTPESLFDLSQTLYPWSFLRTAIPLDKHFLWMDMSKPDPTLIMAGLVGVSTWIQQRMTTPAMPSTDPQQQSINNTMQWMMPLMFAFFTLQFPSGLALYWVATNVFGIVQYTLTGRADWRRIFSFSPQTAPAPAAQANPKPAASSDAPHADGEESEDDSSDESTKARRRRRRGRRRR
jgi:YidC/Oxa1 family membrane protein insertase